MEEEDQFSGSVLSQTKMMEMTLVNTESDNRLLLRKEAQLNHNFTLYKYEDTPGWMQDNIYITSGYRANYSVALCIKSLFRMHNETWSIWTHLVGFLLFFILMFVTFAVLLESPTVGDVFVFLVFLICAQIQMLASAIFHIFYCHSAQVCSWLVRIDYSGINLMIVGSYYPPLYYLFKCYPVWQGTYLALITIIGVAGVIISVLPIFSSPRFRVIRVVFFIMIGFFAVFPLPHLWVLAGTKLVWPVAWREMIMGALYVMGAIIYATRIPERCYPGKFEYSPLSSHSVWHLFTIAAALVQLWVCLFAYHQRIENPCS